MFPGTVTNRSVGNARVPDYTLLHCCVQANCLSSSLLENTRTLYPEPRVIQLPAAAHLLGAKSLCVTAICDTGAPTADQKSPRCRRIEGTGSPKGGYIEFFNLGSAA